MWRVSSCLSSLNETFMCNSITMCHFHQSTVVVTRRTNNESNVQFYFADNTLWWVAIVAKITTCQHPGNCARVCYSRRLPGSRRTLCTGDEQFKICAINLSLIPYAHLCGVSFSLKIIYRWLRLVSFLSPGSFVSSTVVLNLATACGRRQQRRLGQLICSDAFPWVGSS